MDNVKVAKELFPLLGNKDNIVKVFNCYTRVRYDVKDVSVVNVDAIKEIEGVLGVVVDGGQVQVVVGPGKSVKLAQEVNKQLGATGGSGGSDSTTSDGEPDPADYKKNKEKIRAKNPMSGLVKKIAGIFVPIIPGFIVGGLILALDTFLAAQIGDPYTKAPVGIIINVVGSAVFDVLGVIVGYNTCKQFGGDGIIGAILGCVLYAAKLTGIQIGPFTFQAGRGGIISIILLCVAAAYFQQLLRKFIPEMIDSIVTPLITVIVMSVAGLFVFQPLGGLISDGIGNGINAIIKYVPFLLGIVPMFYLFLVMTGMHHSLIAINQALIDGPAHATCLLPVQLMAGAAEVGAAIYFIVKSKSKNAKRTVLEGMPIGFLGIDEPLIYGMSALYRRLFLASSLGGAIAGSLVAVFGITANVPESTGIEAALVTNNPGMFCLCYGIAIGLGFLFAWLFGFRDTYTVAHNETGETKRVYQETGILFCLFRTKINPKIKKVFLKVFKKIDTNVNVKPLVYDENREAVDLINYHVIVKPRNIDVLGNKINNTKK